MMMGNNKNINKVLLSLLIVLVSSFVGEAFSPSARFSIPHSLKSNGFGILTFPSQPTSSSSSSAATASFPKRFDTKLIATIAPQYDSSSSSRNSGIIQRINNFVSSVQNAIKTTKNNEVTMWRMAAATFLSSLVIFRPIIDQGLAKLWTFLMSSSNILAVCFRHDHWEWMLAVTCFVTYIHLFQQADRSVRKAAEQGIDHPFRKYRLQDRMVAQQHHRSLSKKQHEEVSHANDSNVNAIKPGPAPMVTKHAPWHKKTYFGELWYYVVPLFIWDTLDPRRMRGLVKYSAPTTLQICSQVTVGLLLYDFFFFIGHICMHKIPFLWRIHKKHHEPAEVRAIDVARLSFIEEALEVGFSIVALRMLKAHPVSRTIYNTIITFLLTELHCGFDFPWTPQNVVPFGLATGSRRHHYHHRYGRNYYQKFFFTLDRIFGTFQKDDGTAQGDSVKPLENIKQISPVA